MQIKIQLGKLNLQDSLPDILMNSIGAGHWRVTIQPIAPDDSMDMLDQTAFLNGYAPEDEGLYDDYPTR
jgi:hypothetical protein